MSTIFNVPATIVTGAGASRELVPQLARLGARRVLLVTEFTGRRAAAEEAEQAADAAGGNGVAVPAGA